MVWKELLSKIYDVCGEQYLILHVLLWSDELQGIIGTVLHYSSCATVTRIWLFPEKPDYYSYAHTLSQAQGYCTDCHINTNPQESNFSSHTAPHPAGRTKTMNKACGIDLLTRNLLYALEPTLSSPLLTVHQFPRVSYICSALTSLATFSFCGTATSCAWLHNDFRHHHLCHLHETYIDFS